jgi:hypothetical protein
VEEHAWQACTDPTPMLDSLRTSGTASDRKLRLFLVACCRRVWPLLADQRSRQAVAVAERFAEGIATEEDRLAARDAAGQAARAASDATTHFLEQAPIRLIM